MLEPVLRLWAWRWLHCGALALLTLLGAAAPALSTAAPSGPAPVEDFFKPSKISMLQLSPSGRWMAALSSIPGHRVGFVIIDLEGAEPSHFIEASLSVDVSWFHWVSDDWLIFSVEDPEVLDSSRRGPGLMSMRRDGGESRMLIRRRWEVKDPMITRRLLEPNHVLLGYGAANSNEIIVGEMYFDAVGEFSDLAPRALNVATGAIRSLGGDRPKAGWWLIDERGLPRLAVQTKGRETTLFWSDTGTDPWRQIAKGDSFNMPFEPAYIDGSETLVVSTTATGDGHMQLRRFDLATSQPATEMILATPGFSSEPRPVLDGQSGRVHGLHLEVDATTTVWFNSNMKKVQALVDDKLPGRVNVLQCRPCDKPKVVLVYSYSDVQPGEYLLYRPHQDRWAVIDPVRPEIDPTRMAKTDLYRIAARDGADLPLWVTLPTGEGAKPRPAVVIVHGGPHVRGADWSWQADAQFLASRGYAVVAPEFRGSTGYGFRHQRAGWKQWGLSMQDDISDALKFAIGKGWVDPSRVCIMGASYGGYAALMGLAKDPDQYRCGIAFAAVADPRFMFTMYWSDISRNAREFDLPVTLGDPKTDEARFIATSPLEQVARIKAPVLLVHGGADRRVPIASGERMRDALLKGGKTVTWVVYPDEGHGFERTENRVDYWKRVESFLATQLK